MIQILLFYVLFVSVGHAYEFDCGETVDAPIYITEIQDGTIFEIYNTSAPLLWTASYNGTNTQYLSKFFSNVKVTEQTYGLKLVNKLDLEFLEMELKLPMSGPENDILTLDVSVTCIDKTNAWKTMDFTVNVHSVNEFSPEFIGAPFQITVEENLSIGTEIFNIGAKTTDADVGNNNLMFRIVPYLITEFDGLHLVRINIQSGIITLLQSLDYEAFRMNGRTYFFLNVTVTDAGGYSSATSVKVNVTDVNDQGVQLIYPGCDIPCLAANYTVYTNESYMGLLHVLPVDVLGGDLDTLHTTVVYSLISAEDDEFFRIDSSTGQLYKIAPLVNDTYGASFDIQIVALEAINDNHFLLTNITVYIAERMPTTQVEVSNPTVHSIIFKDINYATCYSFIHHVIS